MKESNWIIVLLILSLGWACQSASSAGVRVDPEAPMAKKLSDYRFFTGELRQLIPNDRVLPYDLNTPLFSDYAKKARFVWMPEGTHATMGEEGLLKFPEGAVLIKNFYYPEQVEKQVVETRILINRPTGWEAATYIWNEDQTDADLDLVGAIKDVNWQKENGQAMQVSYIVPNKNQCKSCHVYETELLPIGPKVRNLNKTFDYAEGRQQQLVKWTEVGYLKGYKEGVDYPAVPQWDDPASGGLHERAMAYLDVNCGHCHNPGGPANTTGLNLVYGQEVDLNLGVMKAPVASAKGSGGRDYSIVPGHPEQSILLYRMESNDPGAMMPEIGRQLVHEEGVTLIKEWIQNLSPKTIEMR